MFCCTQYIEGPTLYTFSDSSGMASWNNPNIFQRNVALRSQPPLENAQLLLLCALTMARSKAVVRWSQDRMEWESRRSRKIVWPFWWDKLGQTNSYLLTKWKQITITCFFKPFYRTSNMLNSGAAVSTVNPQSKNTHIAMTGNDEYSECGWLFCFTRATCIFTRVPPPPSLWGSWDSCLQEPCLQDKQRSKIAGWGWLCDGKNGWWIHLIAVFQSNWLCTLWIKCMHSKKKKKKKAIT